jgi:hypothetical protein
VTFARAPRRFEYMAVELQLEGDFTARDNRGLMHKQQGPHFSWRGGDQPMRDALRDFGANGWEMVGVAPSTKDFLCHILYFKREIPGA